MPDIKPGGIFRFRMGLRVRDTLEPIPGKIVELQLFDRVIGDYVTILQGSTDANGNWEGEYRAPTEPGTYRLRSRWEGDETYKGDVSPAVTLRVRE